MQAHPGSSAVRLLLGVIASTALAINLGAAVLVVAASVWLLHSPRALPPAFWNPWAWHERHLLAPSASPDAARVLLTHARAWLGERGADCSVTLLSDAEGRWLALACTRSEGLGALRSALRQEVVAGSGAATMQMNLGSTPVDWIRALGRDNVPHDVQVLVVAAFVGSTALGLLAVATLQRARDRQRSPARQWEVARSAPRWCVALAVAGALLLTLGFAAIRWLLAAAGIQQVEQPIIEAMATSSGIPFWIFAGLAVTLVPLGEELFFRGYVFRSFAAPGNATFGYLASSLLFALVHFHPLLIPSYVAAGLALAWSYDRTRWIGTPILMHAVVNVIGILSLNR